MEQKVLSFKDIPADVIRDAFGLAQQSLAKIAPYLQALTPEDRKVLLKMSDGTEPFVQKSCEYIDNNPSLVPNLMDKDLLTSACSNYNGLTGLYAFLADYTSQISDTRMVAGGNAFYQTLSFYDYVQSAAKKRVPGAKTIVEDLKKRFEKKKKKEEPKKEAKAAKPKDTGMKVKKDDVA